MCNRCERKKRVYDFVTKWVIERQARGEDPDQDTDTDRSIQALYDLLVNKTNEQINEEIEALSIRDHIILLGQMLHAKKSVEACVEALIEQLDDRIIAMQTPEEEAVNLFHRKQLGELDG